MKYFRRQSRPPEIRHRVAGLHLKDGKLLMVKHKKGGREYFLLPGGGQEPGEGALTALHREWQEELNVRIEVGDFLFCGESVPEGERRSQVFQMVFAVNKFIGDIKVRPDGALIDYAWIPVETIDKTPVFPDCSAQIVQYCHGKPYEKYLKYKWLT